MQTSTGKQHASDHHHIPDGADHAHAVNLESLGKFKSPKFRAIFQLVGVSVFGMIANIASVLAVNDIKLGMQLPLAELGVPQFKIYTSIFPWIGIAIAVLASYVTVVLLRRVIEYYRFEYEGVRGYRHISLAKGLVVLLLIFGTITMATSVDNRVAELGTLDRL